MAETESSTNIDYSLPPERPPLGTELVEEMQRHMRACVALGTISVDNAVKLYHDWLIGEPSVG